MFPYIAKLAAIAPFIQLYRANGPRYDPCWETHGWHGFKLSTDQLRGYQFLFQRKQHVQGTLQLMADWNLDSFIKTHTRPKPYSIRHGCE